jgi:hypothetical protein
VSLAKLEARQQSGQAASSCSMASLKRRTFNQHLIDRICEHLANRRRLEKSSPEYDTLCKYDLITELAAYILPEVLLHLIAASLFLPHKEAGMGIPAAFSCSVMSWMR